MRTENESNADGGGQSFDARKGQIGAAPVTRATKANGKGQPSTARKGQTDGAPSVRPRKAGGKGQALVAGKSQKCGAPSSCLPIDLIIDDLRQLHRDRRFAMKTQQKLDRALESHVRRNFTSWSPTAPKEERDKQNAIALQIIENARNGNVDDPIAAKIALHVIGIEQSRKYWDELREAHEIDREKLARKLPVAAWVKSVHGAGLSGLADIIGEAGDIGSYSSVAKLWKRLGFAPYDGFAGSTWRRDTWRPRTLTSEEWIEHPFSPERYAIMRQLADSLFRANWESVDNKNNDTGIARPCGHYGELYAHRRAHTDITHEDWTKGHRKADAIRYMFKKYLRDLWKAWRRAMPSAPEARPDLSCPPSTPSESVEKGHSSDALEAGPDCPCPPSTPLE